jgi:N-acetylglutamate synthase-like GNAT family acetyltransferase
VTTEAPEPGTRDGVLRIRLATADDLSTTAAVHRERLPEGFFARLGPRFVARYHASFAASPDATLLIAERGGRVVGFLAGTVRNAEHYRFVVRRRPYGLASSGLAALVRDLGLASEFARTRVGRYARALGRQVRRRTVTSAHAADGGATPAVTPRPTGPIAVLTHVAVRAEVDGGGAGRALVERFEEDARAAGATEVRLVTASQGGAGGFYRRLGWHGRGVRQGADGSPVEEFRKAL